jgi:steroid 5-alpha reductase family enzyme
VKQGLAFAAVSAVIVFGAAWGIALLRPDPEVVRAVWVSAVLAFGVQLLAFAVAKPFAGSNPIAGWGLGSLLRFAALLLHAFLGVGALGLASGPALVSLAGFLFVTMLVEPLFLRS